jgi:hypothetical protein
LPNEVHRHHAAGTVGLGMSWLRQARVHAANAGANLTLIECDVREFALDEPAALMNCPYRALHHVPTRADRRRVFQRVATSLRPRGRVALNAFAFDHRVAARQGGARHEEPMPPTVPVAVGDTLIDLAIDGGETTPLWWTTQNEWLGPIDVAGQQLETLDGGFAGEPLIDEGAEYAFVAGR